MGLRVFFRRLFQKREWARALGIRQNRPGRKQLRAATVQAVERGCGELEDAAQIMGNAADWAARSRALERLQAPLDRLTGLLPYATEEQAARIREALDTARKAKSAPPPVIQERRGEITFYTVYIPTLDGRFYYLSNTEYPPGEIVRIPFGYADREILGIVREINRFPYNKTPLPMWKMKYILGKAPQPIAEEYRRLTRKPTESEAEPPRCRPD